LPSPVVLTSMNCSESWLASHVRPLLAVGQQPEQKLYPMAAERHVTQLVADQELDAVELTEELVQRVLLVRPLPRQAIAADIPTYLIDSREDAPRRLLAGNTRVR
jgi:hypothetical protein